MKKAVLLILGAVIALGLTTGVGAAQACANEALRIGPAALLPGCRAYEMVSPPEKAGNSVASAVLTGTVRADSSGEEVFYHAKGAFPGNQAGNYQSGYLAQRGENWSSHNTDPPDLNTGDTVESTSIESPDFSQALQYSRLALTPGAIAEGSNLYLLDNSTGARRLMLAKPGKALYAEAATLVNSAGIYLGGTEDWSHILFRSRAVPLTEEEEVPAGQENLYDYSGGAMHLVDRLPDGTVPPNGAKTLPPGAPDSHPISADGSRIFFQVLEGGTEGAVYMRVDDSRTVPISYRAGNEAEVLPAQLAAVSADGSVVYLISTSELLPGVTGSALYRYEVETKTLTDVTPVAEGREPNVTSVLGISEDGSYVYFGASESLLPGVTIEPGQTGIYAEHEGALEYVGTINNVEGVQYAKVSPNGGYLGFSTASPLDAADVPSPACGESERCTNVYAFDFAAKALNCTSCNGPANGDSQLGGIGVSGYNVRFGSVVPHTVLDDGTVYFETPNKLVPRDGNGVTDVYGWREGGLELISTGTSPQPSTFAEATPDGQSVFFVTAQSLVPQDTDSVNDLYVAREDGGLPSQWPPGTLASCEGQACRGTATKPPAGPGLGSSVGVAESCSGLESAAKAAAKRVQQLSAQARRSRRTGANRRAAALRKQVARQRVRAVRLRKEGVQCKGVAR